MFNKNGNNNVFFGVGGAYRSKANNSKQKTSGANKKQPIGYRKSAATLTLSMESLFTKTQSFITNTIASTTATGKISDNLWNVAGKTCIVTGATSGIGLQIALDLVRRGARVILGCRNGQAAEEAIIFIRRHAGLKTAEEAVKHVTWSHLDLASPSSVRRFADEIIRNEQKLHILINNAAVITQRQRQIRLEGSLEVTFSTNHLGPFLLTNLLLPLMKTSAPSRIIMMASDCYKMCRKLFNGQCFNFNDLQYDLNPKQFDPWMAYCQTKLANILFTRTLNWKLNAGGHSGVSVFAVHPGLCHTQLFRNQSRTFMMFFGPLMGRFGKTPREGARTPIYCATQPGLQEFSGRFFTKLRVKNLQPFAMDDRLACKLWSYSSKLVGCSDDGTNFDIDASLLTKCNDTDLTGNSLHSLNASDFASSPPPVSADILQPPAPWKMRRSITDQNLFTPEL